jgi:hypothetical protein
MFHKIPNVAYIFAGFSVWCVSSVYMHKSSGYFQPHEMKHFENKLNSRIDDLDIRTDEILIRIQSNQAKLDSIEKKLDLFNIR